MLSLVIVLGFMFFASPAVAATEHQLLERVRYMTKELLNSMELRVRQDLRPTLVKKAEHRIKEIENATVVFGLNIVKEIVTVSSQINKDIIHLAPVKDANASECDRLFDDLLNSANVSISKANACTADEVYTIGRLINQIKELPPYILYSIRTTMKYRDTESINEAFVGLQTGMLQANSTLNEYLPRLNRKMNELETFLNNQRMNNCLTNSSEYSIYNNTLSTFYQERQKHCREDLHEINAYMIMNSS